MKRKNASANTTATRKTKKVSKASKSQSLEKSGAASKAASSIKKTRSEASAKKTQITPSAQKRADSKKISSDKQSNGNSKSSKSSKSSAKIVPLRKRKEQLIGASKADSRNTIGSNDRKILSVDIGGSNVKVCVNGETNYRKTPSGMELTPLKLVEVVKELTQDWEYDYISIGYPGLTGPSGALSEPYNLGPGWVAFDFAAAFGKEVKVLNDAALQAIGSYEGGRMLFLGLGTGLGSALIADGVIISLELSNMRWNARACVGDVVGKVALKRDGRRRWRKAVAAVVDFAKRSFLADYVVVGGGNAKYLKGLPAGSRIGHNQAAFRGGYRVWELDFIPTVADSVKNKELRVLY